MKNGDIWLINLDPAVGAEIHKTRPAMIVSSDSIGLLPLKVIIPLTDWKPHYGNVSWMVKLEPNELNHLDKISAADAFQVRSVSQERFVKNIGRVDKEVMKKIKNALKDVFEI